MLACLPARHIKEPACTRLNPSSALTLPVASLEYLHGYAAAKPWHKKRHYNAQVTTAAALRTPAAHPVAAAPNEQAVSGRFVCPRASRALCSTAYLSQPLPPHAVAWAQAAWQHNMRQLPFKRKLRLLCAAAASGSTANLEVAWALLQPSVFPDALERPLYEVKGDPGVAALSAGHPQVLGWLLRRCPRLLSPEHVLKAAAQHCDLAGLQGVWGLLQDGHSQGIVAKPPELGQGVLDAAARSATPDAVAKAEWVLGAAGGTCRLQPTTAAAAICAGQLGTLHWLRDKGWRHGADACIRALRHVDLASMQWLVEEGVFDLPTASADPRGWKFAWEAAASSPDGVAKLQWLQERGGPPLDGDLRFVAALATFAGQVEVVQHLLAAYGPAAVLPTGPNGGKPDIAAQAVASGSVCMSECLRQAGLVFGPTAYLHATMFARLATVRWLALEAGVSASGLSGMELYYTVKTWPNNTAADSRDLLEAVQLLVGAGFCSWGEEQEEEEEEALGEEGVQAWGEGDVFAAAVGRGDLALAQYLLQLLPRPEKRLRWGVMAIAADAGCEALLEWLVQQPGCMESPGGPSPYVAAAANGDRGTLEALQRLGVPWGAEDVVVQAVKRWDCTVPALRWLVEQGAPVGRRATLKQEVAGALLCSPPMMPEHVAWLKNLASCQPHGPGHA